MTSLEQVLDLERQHSRVEPVLCDLCELLSKAGPQAEERCNCKEATREQRRQCESEGGLLSLSKMATD